MKIVAFEGQISAGKTTTLRAIDDLRYPNLVSFYEPIQKYRNFQYDRFKCNPLDIILNSKEEIFAVQCFFLDCMNTEYKNIKNFENCSSLFLDRSFMSCSLFINLAYYRQQSMTDFEYYYLKQKIHNYAKEIFPTCKYPKLGVDKVVYFEQNISDCLERIKKRNRPEELPITEDYLRVIQEEYVHLLKELEPDDILTVNSPCDASSKHLVIQSIIDFLYKDG